jgi:hypothetical protein
MTPNRPERSRRRRRKSTEETTKELFLFHKFILDKNVP